MPDDHLEQLIPLWGKRLKRLIILLACTVPFALLLALRLGAFVAVLHLPDNIRIDAHALSASDWITIALLGAIQPLAFLPILWCLYRLFSAYEKGVVFSLRNTQLIKYCGVWLIAVDAARLLQGVLIGPVLSHAGITQPFISIQLGLSYSIIGLFIYLVSKIMGLAQAMKEERDLTI